MVDTYTDHLQATFWLLIVGLDEWTGRIVQPLSRIAAAATACNFPVQIQTQIFNMMFNSDLGSKILV